MGLVRNRKRTASPITKRRPPTPQEAARELLRRRGLIDDDSAPAFITGLRRFKRGHLFPDQLVTLCEETFGFKLPPQGLCPGHSAPGAYLLDALSGGADEDAIVWAARGGGKTAVGALLTLIDSTTRDGCETIVLGGSGEQSKRMNEHTTRYIAAGGLESMLDGDPIQYRTQFRNGSRITVAMASQKSVRGPHVPRLRFDEVDEFDRDIYRAALKMRHSRAGLKGSLHIYSTMHRPGGLMDDIISDATDSGRMTYTWCIWDVAERCEGRECGACVLEPDCKGICKGATGYFSIDDIIAIRTDPGSDDNSWQSEMLCQRPGARSLIWAGYVEAIHDVDTPADHSEMRARLKRVVAGVDWGYENPSAIVVVGEDAEGVAWIIEELYESRLLDDELGQRAAALKEKWGIDRFFCDPSQPGSIAKWRRMGLRAYRANNAVEIGIRVVSSLFQLLPPHNRPRIRIARSCVNLRREIRSYRRRGDDVNSNAADKERESIVKRDDHACDAFRYGVQGLTRRAKWGT